MRLKAISKGLQLSTIAAIISLSSCSEDSGIITPTRSNESEIKSSSISLQSLNGSQISVGDTVNCYGTFEGDTEIDAESISYFWTIKQNDAIIGSFTGENLSSFIPDKAGTYTVDLELNYNGDVTKSTLIVVVVEKEVIIDNSEDQEFTTITNNLPGSYIGTVTTPWTEPYPIAFTINDDGSYSAYNTESDHLPALYYGTDADNSEKQIALTDLTASGAATGEITVYFDAGTTNFDQIRNLRFSDSYEELNFDMWHHNKYGPVEVSLSRTSLDDLPPRPLPTPEITFVDSILPMVWPTAFQDSATIAISSSSSATIEYQIVPLSESISGYHPLGNPAQLWSETATVHEYTGEFTLDGPLEESLLLARVRDSDRVSGIDVFEFQIVASDSDTTL